MNPMHQKELRVALVCYGGISLAVYMHGVTKELWKLARASRAFIAGDHSSGKVEAVYRKLFDRLEQAHGMRLRVMTDIIAGASAGGINGVFLAQAIHSGQSLEPLTRLWLERADVDVLLDPDARPWWKFAKFWAMPIVWFALTRPGNVVSAAVARDTRREVRRKLSRLIRSRWFEPPFGGLGFSRLLAEAFDAMAGSDPDVPLLPPGHPIDLFVTATDFKGRMEALPINSPPLVRESEHRLPIGFRSKVPPRGGEGIAPLPELLFASRSTASFPGAFPAFQISEIDTLMAERDETWASRQEFIDRVLPDHRREGPVEGVSLIDGSVLVNAPFAEAMGALRDRPAQREVDRRFVYIDPTPDRVGAHRRNDPRPPGFFSVIFGSLSSIPREQPVRDNLEILARESGEKARMREIVDALTPEVEGVIENLLGNTLFLARPTVKRLIAWRARAHKAAAKRAGFAFQGYAQLKLSGVIDELARTLLNAAPSLGAAGHASISAHLFSWLEEQGLDRLAAGSGGASQAAINFFTDHDLPFRIRRLRLLARRLTEDWVDLEDVTQDMREQARDSVYRALSLYFERETSGSLGSDFATIAAQVFEHPGKVLAALAERRQLRRIDHMADALLTETLAVMPPALRRRMLLAYLGFSFYDTVTLPLLRGEGLTEFDPVKVDRISPEDAASIRQGGTRETLRGIEFYNFGAFFSRAYRENDYLWGRLHGAERMIDLMVSALPGNSLFPPEELAAFKREAFLAVLDEEERRLIAEPGLVAGIRTEVTTR